jgi:adenosylmethionine-8-amino-7-oxononanoate aminotransferase
MAINDMASLANGHPNGDTTQPKAALPKHEDDNQTAIIPSPIPSVKASSLLHRSFAWAPHSVTSASDLTLTLQNGTPILDACGGAAVSCLGYKPDYVAEITAAMTKQLQSVAYIHTLTYTTPVAEELAGYLIENYGAKYGLEKAYFVGSGSEAMDAAMKFARQYFFETGREERVHYVARRQAYHGNTIGSMSVSSNVPRKAPYVGGRTLQLENVSWVSPAYEYQYADWENGETEEAFAARLVQELEDEFLRVGPEKVIAFIAEPIVGATTGALPAPKGYFQGIRRVCDKYGVLLILDEVMCGMGRTGTMFAFEQEGDGVVPDLMTMGKGLGAGFAPIAAVLMNKTVADGLRSGSGNVAHGHTYQAHPVSCAASLTVQKIIKRDNLLQQCHNMGQILEKLLRKAFNGAKYVGDIRGRGLFWGIEFVCDRETRKPFDPKLLFGPKFQEAVFLKGVAIYPGNGTVDGGKGDHVIISPAFNVTENDLKVIVDIVKEVYLEMEQKLDQV